MAQKTLILATTNQDKLKELRPLFEAAEWPVLTLADFPEMPEAPETRDTFIGNAFQKVRFVHARLVEMGTPGMDDLVLVADDAGLCVDMLGGGPGVRSKRFTVEGTDEANNTELLRRLQQIDDRAAHYTCALAIAHNHYSRCIERSCQGSIGRVPRGSYGFAYDCLFTPRGSRLTLAEMDPAEKNKISHRGMAVQALLRIINIRYRNGRVGPAVVPRGCNAP